MLARGDKNFARFLLAEIRLRPGRDILEQA